MDLQLTSVILLVAAAVCYLLWTAWRTWKGGKTGCRKDCGCGPIRGNAEGNGLISSKNIRLRPRQPER